MEQGQHFKGFEYPSGDFERAREGLATPFRYVDIPLDTALVNSIIPISGDFLYVDVASTGTATLELNNRMDAPEAPLYVAGGFGIKAVFTFIKINSAAQAGKFLRLLYATGESIIPSSSLTQISSILQPVNINDVIGSACQHAAQFGGGTAIGVNLNVVLDPTQNINGVRVRFASVSGAAGAGGTLESVLMAAAVIPTDANSKAHSCALLRGYSSSTVVINQVANPLNRVIPAGWGIWAIDTVTTAVLASLTRYFLDYELL